ncbi:MAG: glycosyltransferase family 39 protein [Candidatus Levybacteria bacterium]|nr:glycosyltransferase family 39 protein [Candidatus Levybacteria bacterium]
MKKIPQGNAIPNWFYKNRNVLLILAVFILSFSLRAYSMDTKYPFGWDQVDNAWAANKIIVNHEFPLVGMVAKGNSGFFIGPAYYYFVAFFYWLTNLNPVASHYIALFMSTFTFFAIFFVTKKIFSFKIALLACFINTVAVAGFSFDSVQWPVSFLPGISLLIFYFLYRLLKGEEKYIIFLAIMVGLAFQIHFTAIFFPIIILLCLPFLPRTKKMFTYSLVSIPLFLIWIAPNIIAQINGNSQSSHLASYISTYYHGFHLRRMTQLIRDAVIQFDAYLFFDKIKSFKIIILPLFFLVYFWKSVSKVKLKFSYLVILWFLVPWIVFTTYRGEISDYYFSMNRFIALLILSYLLSKLVFSKKLLVQIIVIIFLVYYSYQNLNSILNYRDGVAFEERFENIMPYIDSGRKVEFRQGAAESYIYYYLMRKKGVIVY